MSPHNPNFEDKLNPLLSNHQMSLANAAKLDVTDEELDGYIAFRIRNYMQKDEGIPHFSMPMRLTSSIVLEHVSPT